MDTEQASIGNVNGKILIEPVADGIQIQMPRFWDEYDEEHASFALRIPISSIAKCSGKRVTLDTETTGLEWWNDHMIGLGVWCPDAQVYGYIPTVKEETRIAVKAAVRGLDPSTTIIGHNLKFDHHFMDVDPTPFKLWDTTVLIHLYDSRLPKSLAAAEEHFLGTDSKRKHLTKAPPKLKKKVWEWPIPVQADYCVNDCCVTYQLAEHLTPMLREIDLINLMKKDMEYLKVIWRMERKGFLTDPEFIRRAIKRAISDRQAAEKELYEAIGYEFNWKSPKQLSKALYEDYGWPRPVNPFLDADGVDRTRFAASGKYNSTLTDSLILMEKAKHPLGALVLHLRGAKKMLETLTRFQTGADGNNYIHSNFNLTGTRTGRRSSSKPNLQNVESEIRNRETQSIYSGDTTHRIEEYNLRQSFIAPEGWSIAAIDYKQMEMRMFGILAQEPKMLDSLRAGRDIHADVAELVWGVRDEVHREWSKTVGFGLIYAMTVGALQLRLNMTAEEAQAITKQYWSTFPRIKPWLQEIIQECKKDNHVRYWSGRIWKEEVELHMFKAANAVIQGGCADLLSVASLRADALLCQHGWGHMVNEVHDEIVFQLQDKVLNEAIPALSKIMEVPDLLGIPFFTSAKVGKSWGALETWESDLYAI